MSILTDGNLLPYRQYDPAEVLNMFALQGTGLNGQLVAIVTGAQDPINSAGGYTTASVGAAYTNVINYAYGNPRTVRPTQAGDTVYNTIGMTLHTTAVNDENGLPLRLQAYNHTLERGLVQTGFTVPILTRGIVTIKQQSVIGVGFPGYVGVISTGGNGKIEAVSPAGAALGSFASGQGTYSGFQIVGKFLSYSGSSFGGYYQFKLEL